MVGAYFIKASVLRDRLKAARRTGKTDSCLSGIVRSSCLNIDKICQCAFDKENSLLSLLKKLSLCEGEPNGRYL